MVHIRRATEVDIDALKDFHVTNHLDETCHFPGEREHQMSELRIDFPHLYSTDLFLRGMFWIATPEKNDDTIIGCIGISPDKDEPKRISCLNTFSVAKKMRGNNIGSTLLKVALEAVNTDNIGLVTLGGHSKGTDIMGPARYLYEKIGFTIYQKDTVKYGDTSTINVLYYERNKYHEIKDPSLYTMQECNEPTCQHDDEASADRS